VLDNRVLGGICGPEREEVTGDAENCAMRNFTKQARKLV
jgi:hypothetical protein